MLLLIRRNLSLSASASSRSSAGKSVLQIYKPNVSFPWLPVAIFHPLEAPRVYRLGRPRRFRRRHFPLRFNNSAPTPYRTD